MIFHFPTLERCTFMKTTMKISLKMVPSSGSWTNSSIRSFIAEFSNTIYVKILSNTCILIKPQEQKHKITIDLIKVASISRGRCLYLVPHLLVIRYFYASKISTKDRPVASVLNPFFLLSKVCSLLWNLFCSCCFVSEQLKNGRPWIYTKHVEELSSFKMFVYR